MTHPRQEPNIMQVHDHLICWKSSFGGLLIALMTFVTLTALGAGVAAFTAEGLVNQGSGGSALATGTGLYMGLSIVIALFCGGYFALRISGFVTSKVGMAHGFVVASAFFLLMLFGIGNMIGGLASGFGNLARVVGGSSADLINNSGVQDTVYQAIGTSELRSSPAEVAQGLTVRLLQGDEESAKNYLAYQTGQTPIEMEAKIFEIKTRFDAAVKTAAQKTANAIGDTGISFFVLFLVGLFGAGIGGYYGAYSNVERPFAQKMKEPVTVSHLRTQHGSVVPYLFGWLLGVPISILLLIAMFRAVF